MGARGDDVPGKYTFANNIGKSAIDLAWCNLNCTATVTKFEISYSLSSPGYGFCSINFREIIELDPIITLANERSSTWTINFKFNETKVVLYQNCLKNLN